MKKFLLLLTLAFATQQLSALTVTINYTNVSCYNGCNGTATAVPSGGTPPYTYTWNPVFTGNPITGLCAGSYSVTVTDALAATATASVAIFQPLALSSTATQTNVTCNSFCNGSATVNVSGGMAPYSYSWNPTSQITPTATNLCAGTYTCTITDANGCVVTQIITIIQTSPVTITSNPIPTTCNLCNGSIYTTVIGGTPPYTYLWNNSNIDDLQIGLCSGFYSCVVTDANGCTDSTSSTIVNSTTGPSISISSVPTGCNVTNGSATAIAIGNGPFTYSWLTTPVQTTQTATGLDTLTYSVFITDVNGCSTNQNITISDSCDFVWPGDANDDAVADNVDILDIGIANGATGTTRANATLNWIGQPSAPWGQTLLSGTDYKWVDCNGDGTIDLNDTNAVIQNFGFIHNNRLGGIPVYDATLPDLIITMNQDSLAANSAGTLSVALGNSSVPATNVYGLAFTLNFDATQIDASTFRMNENGTWMGIPNTNLFGVVMNEGTGTGAVQIAITRYNQTNANGFGNIANVGFMTTSNLIASNATQNVNFTISNVTVISANETTQQVNVINDSVVVADPNLLNEIFVNESKQQISAYPNPFDELVQINFSGIANGKTCEVTLTDASGRIVLTQKTENANSIIIHRGTLEAGIYFCTVRSEGAVIGNSKLIVK